MTLFHKPKMNRLTCGDLLHVKHILSKAEPNLDYNWKTHKPKFPNKTQLALECSVLFDQFLMKEPSESSSSSDEEHEALKEQIMELKQVDNQISCFVVSTHVLN